MSINEALKSARKGKGYTMEDVAKKLGYSSKATYSYIENNKTKITLEIAEKISQILEKTIEELFPNFFTVKVQDTQTAKKRGPRSKVS